MYGNTIRRVQDVRTEYEINDKFFNLFPKYLLNTCVCARLTYFIKTHIHVAYLDIIGFYLKYALIQ